MTISKSNNMNNMDHTCICIFRVLDPIQWSLAKQSKRLKIPKQVEAKMDGQLRYNLNRVQTRKILMLSKRYEST